MPVTLSRRDALAGSLAFAGGLSPLPARPQDVRATLAPVVETAVRAVMAEHDVPGMAVAVVAGGERQTFAFGLASRESRRPVDAETLFEIGSVSKTVTGLLVGHAEQQGALALSDPAGRHWPALAETPIGGTSLLDLGTYTAGGLPLQFPAAVTDERTMLDFLRRWRPAFPPGTRRVYSNPSIGLCGHLAARALRRRFADVVEADLFPALGMTSSVIRVSRDRMDRYAFGYSRDNRPIRVNPGVLDAEAYGVKTTATDMLRFLAAHLDRSTAPRDWAGAAERAMTGRYRVGPMTQGLGWESYEDPSDLARLGEGNGNRMVFEPNDAERLDPPLAPVPGRLYNKTGSTNGFGAYVVLVPAWRAGVALLGNRNYPVPARLAAAHRILVAARA